MRIQQLFEFTEHHQYYCYRDFSLSTIDYRMLALIYKPIVGAFAVSVYEQLCMMVPEGKTGFSPIEPHRRLLLGLGLALNDQSRTYLLEQFSLLEAIGLLQSSRFMPEQGDFVYEYELTSPLSPNEFFKNIHFMMLLRDKLGKYAVIHIREQLYAPQPEEIEQYHEDKENLSVPFYEIFKLNASIVDDELEQALREVAPARAKPTNSMTNASAGYTYGEIMVRFPRNSTNRYYVEQLRTRAELLAQVNYVAYKYELTLIQVCRLLDEDGVFDVGGEIDLDHMQRIAVQLFRQDKKHEEDRTRLLSRMEVFRSDEPTSIGEDNNVQQTTSNTEAEVDVEEQYHLPVPKLLTSFCDIQQYNALMRNEPHIQFLKRYFPGQVPDWILNTFERIDLHYKLAPPVINVLIHYGIGMNESGRVTKAYLDSIASNMLMKGVDSFEKAVEYVRAQDVLEKEIERRKEGVPHAGSAAGKVASGASNASNNNYAGRNNKWNKGGYRQKPEIPVISNEQVAAPQITAEELEELRELARKIDQQK